MSNQVLTNLLELFHARARMSLDEGDFGGQQSIAQFPQSL